MNGWRTPWKILRHANIKAFVKNLASFIIKLNDRHVFVVEDLMSSKDGLNAHVQLLEFKLTIFKSSTSSLTPIFETMPSKIKVLDLKPFNMARNVQELKCFLWHME